MLEELKRRLDITWNDPLTDAKLNDILTDCKLQLNKYAGCVIDYDTYPDVKGLLLEMCRYAWCNALSDFKINYKSELIMLRANFEVIYSEEENIPNIQ